MKNAYVYYPYGQLPYYGSFWKSKVIGTSYYYNTIVEDIFTSHYQYSNSLYQYIFNYVNYKIGKNIIKKQIAIWGI